MTQEKLERMKANIREAAEKRKALKEAGEMPLVNEAPTPVVNDPIADPAPVETAVETAPVETPAPAALAEPAAAPESFAPPAPGMVPSGWVRPEDLASVVTAAQDEQDATAQVTGDVEAAQSVEVPEAPAGSEIASPVVESILPKDGERKTPVSAEEEVAQEEELAKKKMKESEEEDEDEEVDEEEADDEDVEEDVEEEDGDEIPGEVEGDDEVVNDEDVDEVKDYFEPPAECDDCEDGEGFELVSDGDQLQADVLALTTDADGEEEEEIPSAEEIFDNSNFLDKLEAFFDNKDSEDVADLAAALHDSADFLDYLIGGSDEEEIEDEEEFEESSGRIPFMKSECDEPKHKDIRARIAKHRAMHEAVKYPAGSEPEASQIANTRRQQQVEEENLVRTYEEKLQARKDALRKVRENIKRTRNVNAAAEQAPGVFKESGRHSADRFKKAIRGRFNEENAPRKKTDSWEDNKFIDKYTERQKLNFRDLLNDGTITNLLG